MPPVAYHQEQTSQHFCHCVLLSLSSRKTIQSITECKRPSLTKTRDGKISFSGRPQSPQVRSADPSSPQAPFVYHSTKGPILSPQGTDMVLRWPCANPPKMAPLSQAVRTPSLGKVRFQVQGQFFHGPDKVKRLHCSRLPLPTRRKVLRRDPGQQGLVFGGPRGKKGLDRRGKRRAKG